MSTPHPSPSPHQSPAACDEHKLPIPLELGNEDGKQQQHSSSDRLQRAQWLRAAILGANDGLLSTTSLMLGVGAAKDDRRSMILSGLAGTVAGACSMAVGEFVSVSTQRDIEQATRDLPDFQSESNTTVQKMRSPTLKTIVEEANCSGGASPAGEVLKSPSVPAPATLAQRLTITSPGRSPMMRVLMTDDSNNQLRRESKRDEGDGDETLPNPLKAAVASALAFVMGSAVPLLSTLFVAQSRIRTAILPVVASMALALFGGLGAYLGGSPIRTSALRVLAGGCIAMAICYGLMKPFDHDGNE